GWVPCVSHCIPYRHRRVGGQKLQDFLRRSAVFNPVEHASEYPRGVCRRLFAAEVSVPGPEVADMRPFIACGDLERRAGSGRRFLKYQRDITSQQALRPPAEPFLLT